MRMRSVLMKLELLLRHFLAELFSPFNRCHFCRICSVGLISDSSLPGLPIGLANSSNAVMISRVC